MILERERMQEKTPERVVVVTSLESGIVPLTPGERSMIEHEPQQIEQTAFVDHSYPPFISTDPGRALLEEVREHFTLSEADETIEKARELQRMHPACLP